MRASLDGGPIVWLDDRSAANATISGAKASALARAAAARLPVVPGFVLSTRATASGHNGEPRLLPGLEGDLRVAWERLSDGGSRPLVVRSSSTTEDGTDSSMAGRFTSVLDVRGWANFLAAIDEVLASSQVLTLDGDASATRAPMAVLVQPFLEPACGGVLFGADPITGDHRRLVVAAVAGGPDRLVHGDVDGSHHTLSRRGRRLASSTGVGGVDIDRRLRRGLARLARRTAAVAGGPQDVEWARDEEGHLWLLQSRPITALPPKPTRGPVFGPGPVAETLPDALSPLEIDLWVAPLAAGVRQAIHLTGAVSRRRLAGSPVVTTVGGRAVADLELLGAWRPASRRLSAFDPRPPARRLKAAWRVGRLRAALPSLARDICTEVDRQLLEVPALTACTDAQLVDVLQRVQRALEAVHGYEVLLGLHGDGDAVSTTGVALALQVLATERAGGREDVEIVQQAPVVLALTAPVVGPPAPLPAVLTAVLPATAATNDEDALLREALRIRARWLQELSARAAWVIASRLRGRDLLASAEQIRVLRVDELAALVRFGITPGDLEGREETGSAPLPTAFRLRSDGVPVAVTSVSADTCGVTASGGHARGPVAEADGPVAPGAVLVVQNLDPRLAPLLPSVAAIVAETGSPLSHLAILAREVGIPVVVGVRDAVARFAPGTVVDVDGDQGTVDLVPVGAEVDVEVAG